MALFGPTHPEEPPMNDDHRLLRREEVESLVGLKRSSLYREMRAGRFPLAVADRSSSGALASV